MKKTLKGYLLGFLSAAILICGVTYAANTTTLYDVVVNGIKIVIDGQKINPTDANGNTVEPIIYNGTTYLPVRAVANAFGKAVYWDGPNYTVYLGNMDGKLEYPTVAIENMTNIGTHEIRTTNELTDNYENRYSNAICNAYGNAPEHEFLLNMKYSRFKGTLYVPNGDTADNSAYFKIIADGKTIYTSPDMTKSSTPIPIDVNITGYNDLKIQFSEGVGFWGSELQLCLGDAGFYQ